MPGLVGELHLRASGWYEDNGLLPEAIEHAFSAPDHELAGRLVERGIKEVWPCRGEVPTVLRWLEAFPAGAKRRRPRLFTEHAVALALTGRPDDVEPLLEEAERAASEATADGKDRPFVLGIAPAIQSWLARLRGDAPHAVELARLSLSVLPAEDAPQRIFAAICLGEALRTTGNLSAASEAFAEAVELGQSADHVYGTLTAMVWQARVQAAQGRLQEAEDSFRRARRFVTERRVELLPAAALAYLGMGTLLYERSDLDGAERELKLNTAAARKARRTTIVHKINCNLERDILFLASMRKPSNRPVRPCQIRTIATANSAINMIQSAVMASGGRPNYDNTTSENQQTSATAAIRTSNPILCHGFHPVSVAAAASV